MPELPEVETVVRSLAPHLPGRKILAAEFHSKHVTPGDRTALAARMTGRTIEGVRRRGKYIYITLDQGAFSVHLGMTGKLLLDAPIGTHAYGIFSLDDGVLVYDDPRQFGSIEWNPSLEEKLGPEPLEVSAEEFLPRLKKRTTKMKALLLDQSFVAGIGNIYADEILYAAGVHPLAIAAKVSKQKAALVHHAMREILTLAIEHRGSSISDYVDAEGNRGGFQLLHNAYGREGEPCMRCFGKIRKILVAQRGTHYCPVCQPLHGVVNMIHSKSAAIDVEHKTLHTLGRESTRTEFDYSGSIQQGVYLLHKSQKVWVGPELFRQALDHFAGKEIRGGFREDDPPPGGFGEWLRIQSPRLNSQALGPRQGSFIAAILCAEAGVISRLDGNAVVLTFPI